MKLSPRGIVVTGGAVGLGKANATKLASEHQANLILGARRVDKLEELKHTLEENYAVKCKTIAADLSDINNIERMFRESTQNQEVYGVILNAGITYFGEHQQLAWDQFEQLLATNVSGIIKAVELYLPYLSEKSQGGSIMLVSSVAGLLPVPYQAAYSGSKAFITHYGLALNEELRDKSVSLTVFSSGSIATVMSLIHIFEPTRQS